jgi:hypothetical protein
MRSILSSSLAAAAIAAACQAATGCGRPSACGPPGTTWGQIVNLESSPSYHKQVATDAGTGSPYVACRAEATIPTTLTAAGDPTKVDLTRDALKRGPTLDPVLHSGSPKIGGEQGLAQVLGVGWGIDPDDCHKVALHACDDAVNAYFLHERSVRLQNVICTLNQNEEFCRADPR